MIITGLITEYNPFHLGHEFHLNSAKKLTNADGTICVMSGNFVQRGLPALVDKWKRTEMALKAGVDLVIELPTIYAISSAEFFSFGAISLLNSLNVVDNICFGSECGDINLIQQISEILVSEPENFKELLKRELSLGLPFAKARSNALLTFLKQTSSFNDLENSLKSSNNILAIEYCKSLLKLNSKIKPFTIQRLGSGYNDDKLPSYSFASASAIRSTLYNNNTLDDCLEFIPKYTYDILNTASFSNTSSMFSYIKYRILSAPSCLDCIPEAREGLNNKIIANINVANSLEELIILCKSKRYSYTRINRVLCQCFLGLSKDDISLRSTEPTYIRVLGLNDVGAKILKEIKKNSPIEIVNKISKSSRNSMLNLDIKATNLYSLLNSSLKYNSDFTVSPIIIK